VVTYDPRGVERSTKADPASPSTPDQHADDVHRIIAALDSGPVDLFASSGGAVNALALVAKHPEQVRTLVAHEPPLASILPDREGAMAATQAIADTYQRHGFGAGMAHFIAATSHQGPFDADFLAEPAPDPVMFGLPTEDDGTRTDPLLFQNITTCTHYEPDFDALRAASTRIVMAAGVESEGTMAVITRIQVRLLAVPEAVQTLMAAFPTIETASHAVSDVIGHGIVPAALEMMDETTVGAVEAHYHAGYPTDAGAVLLVEVDGLVESAQELMHEVRRILERNEAFSVRLAADETERELLWAGRKGAIGALGRIKPNYYLHDGVVPRTRLPEVLRRVGEIAVHYQLPVANVFHAGDGNLHPNILFDLREPGTLARVEKAGEEMLRACIEAGGTLSGEHGIGLEKNAFMPWIYSPDDLQVMHRVKDVLDPHGLLNPGKIFPDPDQSDPKLVARTGVAADARWW